MTYPNKQSQRDNQEYEFVTKQGVLTRASRRPADAIYIKADSKVGMVQLWGDLSTSIDSGLVGLYDDFQNKIFKDIEGAESLPHFYPSWVYDAGHNTESALSRIEFEKHIRENKNLPELHRMLYLADCWALISSVQSSSIEVSYLKEDFFLSLNSIDPGRSPSSGDGIWHHSSPNALNLFTSLGAIYIRMHSALELVFKLAYEAMNLRTDFTNYPRYGSRKSSFKNNVPDGWPDIEGTLFEKTEFVQEVINIRNHYLHNGFFDAQPKLYVVEENTQIVEKFILFPDIVDGNLERYTNRTCFYGGENKINFRLTDLVIEFQERMLKTVQTIESMMRD